MSALIGLGMLMHGLTGYENRNQRIKADERQDKVDAAQAARDAMAAERQTWDRETADAQRRAREDRQAIDRAIAEGGKAGTVEDAGAVSYIDAAGAKKTAYQPDLKTAQFAADMQRAEEGLNPNATPSAPKAEQAASVRTLDGARRLFSGLTAAADAKKFSDENPVTPYAKYMALSERLSTMAGGQEKADAMLKRAKDAEKEGAFRALNMLDAGDADGALNAWNSTGAKRLEAGQKFVTMADKAGNKTHQVVNSDGSVAVPNVEQAMLRYLSGIEGVAKQAEARANTRAKVQEELFKPRVLKPGEKFGALDPADGKWKEFAEGAIPKGYEVVTDQSGNTLLRPMDQGGRGSGAGNAGSAGDKPKDPLGEATKAVEFVIDKSVAKGALEPQAVARANTIGRQLVASASAEGRGLDPSVAAELAINVATGKMAPVNAFNPRTGTVDSVVDYQGNKFAVESFGSPTNSRLAPEQMAAVAVGFINQVPAEQRPLLVSAAYNPQARAKLDAQVEARLRAPESLAAFEQRLGRKPTDADLTQAGAAAKTAMQPQLELISRWATRTPDGQDLVRKTLKDAGYTSDGKSEAPKKAAPTAESARLQQPGGLVPRPTLAQRQQAIQAAKERMATEEADAARTAMTEAQRLLQAGNVPALARFQASSAFSQLDRATKTAIYNKVNGLQ